MNILHRVHIPTFVSLVGVVLVLFVLYHLCFGRRGSGGNQYR